MIKAFIGTYCNKLLAVGAAKSLRKNILDDLHITLICGMDKKNELQDPIFDDYKEHSFMAINTRSNGFKVALETCHYNHEQHKCLYIDDDLRLMKQISIHNRYPENFYMASIQYFLIYIWQGSLHSCVANKQKLPLIKINSIDQCYGWNDKLTQLALANGCERIDDIWLHIDKASLGPWSLVKRELIDYLDN